MTVAPGTSARSVAARIEEEPVALGLGVALMLLMLLGFGAVGAWAMVALVRRNAARAGDLRGRWAALAAAHGLAFAPGSAFQDPVLSGTFGGCPVTLTLRRYQMGAGGMSYDYTVARAPVRSRGEALVAERSRVHHVAPVGGPEVVVGDPRLAATHVARGYPPELAMALLAPDLVGRLIQNQISHGRLADGQLLIQRPGHHADAGVCLALMQLTADLAHRL